MFGNERDICPIWEKFNVVSGIIIIMFFLMLCCISPTQVALLSLYNVIFVSIVYAR